MRGVKHSANILLEQIIPFTSKDAECSTNGTIKICVLVRGHNTP